MVSLGAENVQSEDDIKGNVRPLSGRYHVAVKEVEEKEFKKENEKTGEVTYVTKFIFEFEVLAGTIPGQEGRIIPEYFTDSPKAKSRLERLALCLGLLQSGEKERDVELADGVARQLVIEVEDNQYEKDGKTVKGVRVAYLGFWSLGNKEVEDVPKDKEAMKLAGKGEGGKSGDDDGQGAEGEGKEKSSKDKWADL